MVTSAGHLNKTTRGAGKGLKRMPPATKPSMMSGGLNLRTILIGVIIVALGVWGTITFSQSREKRVKKQFHLLSEAISKVPGENIFTLDQKLKKIGSLFGDTCDIKIPSQSLSGSLARDEITGYAARARFHFSQLNIKFYDFDISFLMEEEATVRLTGRLTGKTNSGEDVDEAHELECLLKKTDKNWIFSRVEVVEVLKR